MNRVDELKTRIEAKRHELIAKLKTSEADAQHEALDAKDKIKASLSEFEMNLKDGWDKMSDQVHAKLSSWLAKN